MIVEVVVPPVRGRVAKEPEAEPELAETDVEATPRPTRVANGVGVGVMKGRKRLWVDEAADEEEDGEAADGAGGEETPESEQPSEEENEPTTPPETTTTHQQDTTPAPPHQQPTTTYTSPPTESDSDSEDEAPTSVSLSTSRAQSLHSALQQQEAVRQVREAKRVRRRKVQVQLAQQRQVKKEKSRPVVAVAVGGEEDVRADAEEMKVEKEATGGEEMEVEKEVTKEGHMPASILASLARMEESEPAPQPKNKHTRLDAETEESIQRKLERQKRKKQKLEKDRIVAGFRVTPLTSTPAPRVADEAVLAFRNKALFRKGVRRGDAVKTMAGKDFRTGSAVVFVRKGSEATHVAKKNKRK
ncbi:hypothetical protein HDV00_008019 [Rhizophlyctis rosea]|nr:hypothetical protein HDV00_008019 [Rhizophlyctis rosea]